MSDWGDHLGGHLSGHLSGHLGDRAAALVDGQLGAAEEERAWAHVHACPGCRAAVEQQAVAKRTPSSLGDVVPAPERAGWLQPEALAAWAEVAVVERGARRRTRVAGLLGGGALTASLAAAVAVGGLGGSAPPVRPQPADVVRSVPTPGAAVTATPTWTGTPLGSETSRALRSDRTD